jgi:hypothetical protein
VRNIEKKRNQVLSQEEKVYNPEHVKKRIVIEYVICRLNKYRIMSDGFRNKLRKDSKVSNIVPCIVTIK